MRPASRSAFAPPGTGMRLGTSGARMGTAAGRPMSGMRTGVVPSTASREAAVGMALAQEVKISDRPVTQQGMSGMRTSAGSSGPGRLVADGSYYLGALRTKINDIQKELQRLRTEMDQHNTDNSQYGGLERRYESLLKEVKGLEGTLADYNLAMDKARTTADPEEVGAYLHELEDRNRRAAQVLDNIFLVKQQREQSRKDEEAAIDRLHRQLEEQIGMLDPQRVQQYRDLLAKSHELTQELHAKQEAVDKVSASVREHEHALQDSSLRDAYSDSERKVAKLRKEREGVLEELNMMQMDPKSAKDSLLAKVKSNQTRSNVLDGRLEETKEDLTRMTKTIADMESSLKSGKRGDIDPSKVELLQKRDEEMTLFLSKFDETRQSVIADQKRAQDTIVRLMEHIAQGLEARHNIPEGEEKLLELQDEASFKDKQLKSSEMTMKRLHQEKEKREQEMAKLTTLDEKIPKELEALVEKTRRMRSEMDEFEDLEGLRKRAEETKDYLTKLRSRYVKRKDTIKVQVQQLSSKYESLKKELSSSETHKILDGQEQKLRSHEVNMFQLREFVETRGREIDFETLREDCKSVTNTINELIKNPEKATAY